MGEVNKNIPIRSDWNDWKAAAQVAIRKKYLRMLNERLEEGRRFVDDEAFNKIIVNSLKRKIVTLDGVTSYSDSDFGIDRAYAYSTPEEKQAVAEDYRYKVDVPLEVKPYEPEQPPEFRRPPTQDQLYNAPEYEPYEAEFEQPWEPWVPEEPEQKEVRMEQELPIFTSKEYYIALDAFRYNSETSRFDRVGLALTPVNTFGYVVSAEGEPEPEAQEEKTLVWKLFTKRGVEDRVEYLENPRERFKTIGEFGAVTYIQKVPPSFPPENVGIRKTMVEVIPAWVEDKSELKLINIGYNEGHGDIGSLGNPTQYTGQIGLEMDELTQVKWITNAYGHLQDCYDTVFRNKVSRVPRPEVWPFLVKYPDNCWKCSHFRNFRTTATPIASYEATRSYGEGGMNIFYKPVIDSETGEVGEWTELEPLVWDFVVDSRCVIDFPGAPHATVPLVDIAIGTVWEMWFTAGGPWETNYYSNRVKFFLRYFGSYTVPQRNWINDPVYGFEWTERVYGITPSRKLFYSCRYITPKINHRLCTVINASWMDFDITNSFEALVAESSGKVPYTTMLKRYIYDNSLTLLKPTDTYAGVSDELAEALDPGCGVTEASSYNIMESEIESGMWRDMVGFSTMNYQFLSLDSADRRHRIDYDVEETLFWKGKFYKIAKLEANLTPLRIKPADRNKYNGYTVKTHMIYESAMRTDDPTQQSHPEIDEFGLHTAMATTTTVYDPLPPRVISESGLQWKVYEDGDWGQKVVDSLVIAVCDPSTNTVRSDVINSRSQAANRPETQPIVRPWGATSNQYADSQYIYLMRDKQNRDVYTNGKARLVLVR